MRSYEELKDLSYSEYTEEEKKAYRVAWREMLDEYCPADAYGNRPCDWGCPCDRCQYDKVADDICKTIYNTMKDGR